MAAIALYPLSMGPAVWLNDRGIIPAEPLKLIYRPFFTPSGVSIPMQRYLDLWGWSDI
jgi:hypothetical protein